VAFCPHPLVLGRAAFVRHAAGCCCCCAAAAALKPLARGGRAAAAAAAAAAQGVHEMQVWNRMSVCMTSSLAGQSCQPMRFFFHSSFYEAFSSFAVMKVLFSEVQNGTTQAASVTNLPLLPLCCCPWVRPFLTALIYRTCVKTWILPPHCRSRPQTTGAACDASRFTFRRRLSKRRQRACRRLSPHYTIDCSSNRKLKQ
jgi:hypothetical protein